ncbi:hypothetical protein MSG28_014836 [Choristoneura fumiferana]|uniref:Uncharacterized protein n=1 Tax=Choristoneura fumiferana TaxID=7141 RepID=A0ACC0JSW4_CHOFU|nr:hypothetical protein MSG28_014836 [Choristoneura fumiferana]
MCPKRLKSRKFLQIHKHNAHTGRRYGYLCPVCAHRFEKPNKVRAHARRVHGLGLPDAHHPPICTLCLKREKSKKLLQVHVFKAHREKRYRYICPVCCDTFTRPGNVRQHLARSHGVPRPSQPAIARYQVGAVQPRPAQPTIAWYQVSAVYQVEAVQSRPAQPAIARYQVSAQCTRSGRCSRDPPSPPSPGTRSVHSVPGRAVQSRPAQPAIARYQVGAVKPRPAQPAIARYQVSAQCTRSGRCSRDPPSPPSPGYQVSAQCTRSGRCSRGPPSPPSPGTRSVHSVTGRGGAAATAQPAIARYQVSAVYQVEAVQSRPAQPAIARYQVSAQCTRSGRCSRDPPSPPSPGTRSVHSVPGRGGAAATRPAHYRRYQVSAVYQVEAVQSRPAQPAIARYQVHMTNVSEDKPPSAAPQTFV